MIQLLKSKIQELVVTESRIDYLGSISLPSEIMKASGIVQFEQVFVNNKSNGNRIITYAVENKNIGCVTLNGAASKLFNHGDIIHVMSYIFLSDAEMISFQPTLVLADWNNKLIEAKPYVFE